MASISESSSSHDYSRLFTFKTDTDSSSRGLSEIQVKIPEILHPDYGMYTWPSAVVLAQYFWHHRNQIGGCYVLELGAGTALPGIVAAKCGAHVILSDKTWLPAKQSCLVNNLENVSVLRITWGCFTPEVLALKNLQYVISSDCFYDTKEHFSALAFQLRNFENILATVALLLERNPGSKFLSSYQIRCTNWTVSELLAKWNLVCTNIPLSSFGADSDNIAESSLPGRHTIQMLQITRVPD